MARLLVKEGASERIIDLVDEITVVGRDHDNRIVLQDKQSSRRHCQIERTGHGFKLVDLESRNGTRVNDRTVNQAVLRPGDRVQVGSTVILFEDPEFREPPAETPSRGAAVPAAGATTPPPLTPVKAPAAIIPPREPQPALRSRSTEARAAWSSRVRSTHDRTREQKTVRAVAAICVFLGLVVGALILSSSLSGESLPEKRARDQYAVAKGLLQEKRLAEARDALRALVADQPGHKEAQELLRQVDADITRVDAAAGEAERRDFERLSRFVDANRADPRSHPGILAECADFRTKYPRSAYLAKVDEFAKAARETRTEGVKTFLADAALQVGADVRKNDFASALQKLAPALEKHKTDLEVHGALVKLHDDVVDKAEAFWRSEDAKAKDLKARGRRDEARGVYEEALKNLGEGKVPQLEVWCNLARTFIEQLK